MKRHPLYRLEINWFFDEHEDAACESSTPIYSKKEGLAEYLKAIRENCIDNPQQPARVHLWRYNWDIAGRNHPVTICKNY